MNQNNQNVWDGRRPSLDRWWESADNQNYEMPDIVTTSPTAIQNTKEWIERSLEQLNKNTAGKCRKHSIAKKSVSKQNNIIIIPIHILYYYIY